ncbi:hypothetical protein PoB_003396900 [Plakobranchus ocellatus]|uniref:Uncharacterized protein n=1 Tax=Plakobranchus ocellatus TaxID=259542 RepID=A0AAV4AM74_9GAST|nr:hypothetical protein PoB_003396900 [Plakobranchus ocellatus]
MRRSSGELTKKLRPISILSEKRGWANSSGNRHVTLEEERRQTKEGIGRQHTRVTGLKLRNAQRKAENREE